MTREAFLISLAAFQMSLTHNQHEVYLRDSESTLHSRVTTEYLIKLVEELQVESDQLVVEGCTQEKETIRSQAKQSSYIAQSVSTDDSSAYMDAVQRLAYHGVDMTLADGSFRPEQPLTQAQYFSALRQIDRLWAARFGADSIILGYPDYAELTPVVREGLDTELGELFPRIARVRSLINTFCDQEVSLTSDKATSANLPNVIATKAVQNRIAKATERKTANDIREISNVHPEDVVFPALSYLMNEWGIEVILQPDESIDLEGTIMRGEAAIYAAQLVDEYVQILGGYFNEYEFASLYQQLAEELEEIEVLLNE